MAHPELTNLLPPERKKALRRIYLVRLATLCVLMISFIVLSSGVLLVPSYIYQHQRNALSQSELTTLNASLTLSGGRDVATRFKLLSQDAAYLSRLATTSSASVLVTAITNQPHAGINISGLSYTPSSSGKGTDGRLVLNGMALNRTALHAYVDALSKQPFVTNADLPISSYATEKDIPFTITLTGTLTP